MMKQRKLQAILALLMCIMMVLTLAGCRDTGAIQEESAAGSGAEESSEITPPDAEAYYEEHSKVVSEIDAKDAEDVQTGAEACDELTERGFTQTTVTSSYSMDGDYYEAVEITDESIEKHPIYETYYVTESEDIWTIFVINGMTMANPVSYNVQSELGVQVIVSESETVMSYDSTTNKFFETIPNETALIVVTVEKVDAETLETLTVGEIDGYVQ